MVESMLKIWKFCLPCST